MKKYLLAAFCLAMAMTGLGAQQTTWVNPNGKFTTEWLDTAYLPGSLLSHVSRGIFYDEWDIVFSSPAELSNYSGVNILSAYANSTYPYASTDTNNFFDDGAGLNKGKYVFGLALPVGAFRLGAVAGFSVSTTNEFGVAPNEYSNESHKTQTDIDVAGTAGTIDSSVATDYARTSFTDTSTYYAAAGMDLGFMGASIIAQYDTNVKNIGGKYNRTWTKGADGAVPVPADTTTSIDTVYGCGLDGLTTPWANSIFNLNAIAQLPLAGIPLIPDFWLTAGLGFNWTDSYGATFAAKAPVTTTVIATNVTGATNATANMTYTYTGNAGAATNWTEANAAASTAYQTAAALGTLSAGFGTYDGTVGANAAVDALKCGSNEAGITLSGSSDPVFKLSDSQRIRTRAKLDYGFKMGSTINAYKGSIAFTGVDGSAAYGYNYSASYASSSSTEIMTNDIGLELGGIWEAVDPSKTLTFAAGFFVAPDFNLAYSWDGTTTTSVSKTMTALAGYTGTEMPANATGSQIAAIVTTIDTATPYLGTAGYTYTQENVDTYGTNTTSFQFTLPVSLKYEIPKAKLTLVGGYDLVSSFGYTLQYMYDKQDPAPVITNFTYKNSAGADQLSGAAPVVGAGSASGYSDRGTWTNVAWTGDINWMIRFQPTPVVTLDLAGSMVQNALDFSVFGTGAGFNPNTFVQNLDFSIGLRF